ncbi:MAG: oligosaccharide flippase family protein [Acidimicrobiales bacterium]
MGASEPKGGAGGAEDLTVLARGGVVNLAGSLVNAVANFALVVVITRGFDLGTAGAFLEATAMFQILATAGQLGADTGLARFLPTALALDRKGDLRPVTRAAFLPVLAVGVATGVAGFVGAGALGGLVAEGRHQPDFVDAFRVLTLFVPLGAAYFVLQTGTRSFGTMVPSVVVERLGRAALSPLIVLAVVANGMGTGAAAGAWITPYAIAVVPLALWYRKLLRRVAPRTVHPSDATGVGTRFWRFSGPRAVAGTFQVAVLWLDVLLVGALASPATAAIYSASSRWLIAGLFVTLAVNQAFQPQISGLLAVGALERARTLFQTSTAWVVAFVLPIYLTLAVFGEVLVSVFGEGYQEGATALAILAAAGLISSASGPVTMVLLMGGGSTDNLLITGAALVTNVVANIVLVPRFGVEGAAAAWALSIGVDNGLALVQVWRRLGIHPFGTGMVRVAPLCLVAAGGGLVGSRLILGPTVAGLATGVAAGGLLYGFGLWRLAPALDADALQAAFKGRAERRRPVP